MSEVKRLQPNTSDITETAKRMNEVIRYTDLQSERAARIAAETKLAELEDAIRNREDFMKAENEVYYTHNDVNRIFTAIENSRARSKS